MFDEHIFVASLGEEAEVYAPKAVKAAPAPVQRPAAPAYKEAASEEDLADILKDITRRYSELDFDNNDDMPKKLRLIEDIEDLIRRENAKGEGINSSNPDISQIFVDLQGIVDDMKNAL